MKPNEHLDAAIKKKIHPLASFIFMTRWRLPTAIG
jgi:hypothetical protein